MIWAHLGFNRDIFFVEPLRPTEQDIKLFVGRDKEINRYLVDTLSGERSLKVVTGEVGVGKTTFVNACQYFSYINQEPEGFRFALPRVLPCFEKIQIREADDLDLFIQQTITSVCISIALHCRLEKIEPPKEVQEILSVFLDVMIKTGGAGVSIGASLLGSGLDFGRSAEGKAQNVIKNGRIHLTHLVEIAREKLGFRGVFILVNNLDLLSKERLVTFFNAARDELFDLPGIYWTVIGRKGVGSIIETEISRVANYLSGTELYIPPLTYEKAKEVIDRRVQMFRKQDSIRSPLTDETIKIIHHFSMREIRETLKTSGDLVKSVIMVNPSLNPIPTDVAMSAFVQLAHERAKDLELSTAATNILKAVADKESCRPKDFAKYGYKTPQAFSAALKGLVKKKLLSVEERGKATYYRMTGMTLFAAITGALGTDIQREAMEKLQTHRKSITGEDRLFSGQLEFQFDD
ncbi:MAG: hypothetical protein AB1644_05205 [Candidatus Zixiibacteriota bacterium]